MIVRDEARCLARCLDSAAAHVDDMLVVDTGSTDDTVQIARHCGARVVHLAWPDDFAAARNHALAQTPAADWHLVLDADEWIASGGGSLREAVRAPTPPFVGQICLQEAPEAGQATRPAVQWLARLLPRGVYYSGRIHEQVVHRLPFRRLDVQVGHDGYHRGQLQRKADRNERLLRRELTATPEQPYLCYQLARELENRGDYAQACTWYLRAWQLLPPAPAGSPSAGALLQRLPWLHDMIVRHLFCLKRERQFAAALELEQAQRANWQHSADFHFAVGDLLLDLAVAEPQRAAQLLPLIDASWRRCLQIGETPQLDGAVAGRGSTLAAHNLAVLHESLGNAADAARFRALARPAR